jgi:thiamine kinase-like enzyme
MENIEGEMLSEMTNDNLVKIAQTVAKVHTPEFERPGIPFRNRVEASQYDRLTEQIDFLRDWFDKLGHYINEVSEGGNFDFEQLSEAKDAILAKAAEARESFQDHSFSLIHFDLNPGNILKDREGNILLLDWRQASIGDRAMDIAKFFFKNNLGDRQHEIFLDVYSSELNDETLRKRIDVYTPLLRLVSLLCRLRFLNIDIKEHPEITQGVNIDLVRVRLDDDYQYLINSAKTSTNK